MRIMTQVGITAGLLDCIGSEEMNPELGSMAVK